MYAQVENIRENKSRVIVDSVGNFPTQKNNYRKQGIRFSTNRFFPIQLWDLKDRAKARGKQLPKGMTFKKNGKKMNDGSVYDLLIDQEPDSIKKNLLDAIKYSASRFSQVGSIAKDISTQDGGLVTLGNTRDANKMYPFIFESTVRFKEGSEEKSIILGYKYANNTPGYVVYQEVTGEEMAEMSGVKNNEEQAGYAKTYFSSHNDSGDKKISKQINQIVTDKQSNNSLRLEARTKLAGEGARFDVVLNNMNALSDETPIYTVSGNGKNAHYIKFSELWKNWALVFGSKYGISNNVVAEKLKTPNIWGNYKPSLVEYKGVEKNKLSLGIKL